MVELRWVRRPTLSVRLVSFAGGDDEIKPIETEMILQYRQTCLPPDEHIYTPWTDVPIEDED